VGQSDCWRADHQISARNGIASLDLEFSVQDGEYVVRRIARSEELTGSDVVLIHRLAKGTAGASIGNHA
jgi:hypothetical protein